MAHEVTEHDDPTRLEAVRSYEILDTPSEPAFDRLAKPAAQVCGASYAAITFADGTKQFVKAKVA